MNKNPFVPQPSFTHPHPPLPPGPPPPQNAQQQQDYSAYWAAVGAAAASAQQQQAQPPPPVGPYATQWTPPRPTAEQSALYANYGYGGQANLQWQQQQQRAQAQAQAQAQAIFHPPPPPVVQPPAPPPQQTITAAPPTPYNPYQPSVGYAQPYIPQAAPIHQGLAIYPPAPAQQPVQQAIFQVPPTLHHPGHPSQGGFNTHGQGHVHGHGRGGGNHHNINHNHHGVNTNNNHGQHLPPAKRQRFDGPSSHNPPHHQQQRQPPPQPPQPHFQPPPQPPQQPSHFQGGRGGQPSRGGTVNRGGNAGGRGRGGSMNAGSGGGGGGGGGNKVLFGRNAGGRGGSFVGSSGGGGGGGGGGGRGGGGSLRGQGSRGGFGGNQGRRGGGSFSGGSGGGHSQGGQGGFRGRGGNRSRYDGSNSNLRSDGGNGGGGTSSGGGGGKKDENRRTLTDFKIIGLAIEELGWDWGIKPSVVCVKEEEKPTETVKDGEKSSVSENEGGEGLEVVKEEAEPEEEISESQATVKDEPMYASDVAKGELGFETQINDPDLTGETSSSTLVILEDVISKAPSTAPSSKDPQTGAFTTPPPSRIRIYFHTPATADDAHPIPHGPLANTTNASSDTRKGKRKKLAEDDEGMDEEERKRVPPVPAAHLTVDAGAGSSALGTVTVSAPSSPSLALPLTLSPHRQSEIPSAPPSEADWLMGEGEGALGETEDEDDALRVSEIVGEDGGAETDAEDVNLGNAEETLNEESRLEAANEPEADLAKPDADSQDGVNGYSPYTKKGINGADTDNANANAGADLASISGNGELDREGAPSPSPLPQPKPEIASVRTPGAPGLNASALDVMAPFECVEVSTDGSGVVESEAASKDFSFLTVPAVEVAAPAVESVLAEIPIAVGAASSESKKEEPSADFVGIQTPQVLPLAKDVIATANAALAKLVTTLDSTAEITNTVLPDIVRVPHSHSLAVALNGVDSVALTPGDEEIATAAQAVETSSFAAADHLPEPPASPGSNALLSTSSTSTYGGSPVMQDVSTTVNVTTNHSSKGSRVPSANRLSMSYAGGSRRLVVDAEVVETLKVFRKEGRIEVKMNVEKEGEDGLKGVLVEGLSDTTKSYLPLAILAPDTRISDETLPPFEELPIPSTINLLIYLDTERPLSEPKWVKSGDVQEWLKSMFGRMFWVAGAAAEGWEKKIQVMDPDPPPTIWSVLDGWAVISPVGAQSERQRFIKTHMTEIDNLLEILLRLVRGERATPFSAPAMSTPSISGPLLSALAPGSAHGAQQTHVSLAVLAMFRMSADYAKRAEGDKGSKEVEERVGEIIRCLPSHLVYKSLDGIFKEWRVDKKGR